MLNSGGRRLPFGKAGSSSNPHFDERYNVPFNQFAKQLNPEETEKELKELLQNIQYEDTSTPQDRGNTPDRLRVTLMEHQKVGLQWLKRNEESSNKGGMLCDDMGLGKTIQAMALIAARPCTDATPLRHLPMMRRGKRRANQELIKTKATLVVCPVSLVAQWERELVTKTNPPLKVYVHHGPQRSADETEIADYDVIVTAYTIVGNECVEEEDRRGPLGRLKYHRVILDEAHTIKNYRTIMAVACCRLETEYRWCMTATPIQNRVEELYSLIKFLRIRPYCEWKEFRDEIKKPLNNGDQKFALKRVQALLKAIALRRSKKAKIDGRPILNLPERNVHFTHINFTPDERAFYDFVNQKSQAQFNRYMKAGTVMKNYSSVLVLLLRLRQACLHPRLTMLDRSSEEEDVDVDAQEDLAASMDKTVVNRLLHDDTDFSQIECPICMDMADHAQIIPGCGHMLCRECLGNYLNSERGESEKRCPQCRGQLVGDKVVTIEVFLKMHAPDLYDEFIGNKEARNEEEKEINTRAEDLPSSSKIDKMLEILHETRRQTKNGDKTIVFSQFTAFLDIMETPLRENEFKYVRFDGSMTVAKRDEVLQTFFNDPRYTVLLVSTKCGSLGLNLTCANRVILMDVWWNPALENQAIDRVHRIGQRKNVEVHRIFINDTVEDRILELQKKKQALADGALGEGGAEKLGRLGLDELLYLFRGSSSG
ncbi:SNF2 family N-terminal domain-containing protein [Zychaea mexicana]|uniref:SNF2 family N-terminal domain-containing protein n=1 Tax=Zychaea mexicana TaxID=64656 RepID=UPI0022FE759B|nr:SNF2 family N-terminal domain-containing protein [Zychaea mexicana]KAI9498457.1 SNF2 family N-terminal domain-containing protein [Zychaea mexicana]